MVQLSGLWIDGADGEDVTVIVDDDLDTSLMVEKCLIVGENVCLNIADIHRLVPSNYIYTLHKHGRSTATFFGWQLDQVAEP